jgi:hypothetical protein
MKNKIAASILYLSLAVMLAACASGGEAVLAPNTQAGDQLKPEYLYGRWCTNRELTSEANTESGFSALLNLSKEFWEFRESGRWNNSETGWMFAHYGEWQLQDRDTVILDRLRGDPVSYQASFRNSGVDLYLTDEAGHYLVLSRCE